MADIILEPGEQFEHQHSVSSTTTVIEGQAEIAYAGVSRVLTTGDSVTVPPNTTHVLTNTGEQSARLRCIHKPQPSPPA